MTNRKQIAALEARAEAGDRESQYDIAQRSLSGDGVLLDRQRARKLMNQAAANRHPDANYILGIWAQTGEFESENYEVAARYYETAAELGHAKSMLNLGILYQVGVGRPLDVEAARDMYVRATEAGSGHAAANLGKLYAAGALTDGDSDLGSAIEWYRKAIRLGYAEARTDLEQAQTALGIPASMIGGARTKSTSLWKRLLGIR